MPNFIIVSFDQNHVLHLRINRNSDRWQRHSFPEWINDSKISIHVWEEHDFSLQIFEAKTGATLKGFDVRCVAQWVMQNSTCRIPHKLESVSNNDWLTCFIDINKEKIVNAKVNLSVVLFGKYSITSSVQFSTHCSSMHGQICTAIGLSYITNDTMFQVWEVICNARAFCPEEEVWLSRSNEDTLIDSRSIRAVLAQFDQVLSSLQRTCYSLTKKK